MVPYVFENVHASSNGMHRACVFLCGSLMPSESWLGRQGCKGHTPHPGTMPLVMPSAHEILFAMSSSAVVARCP